MSSTINTVSFTVSGPDGSLVPGVVQYQDNSRTAVFIPSANLLPGNTYTARITAGVQDLFGNPMQNDKVWSFTVPAANAPQNPRSD